MNLMMMMCHEIQQMADSLRLHDIVSSMTSVKSPRGLPRTPSFDDRWGLPRMQGSIGLCVAESNLYPQKILTLCTAV